MLLFINIRYWEPDDSTKLNLKAEQISIWGNELGKFNTRFGLDIRPSKGTLGLPTPFSSKNEFQKIITFISGYLSSKLSLESIAACEMMIRDLKSCILAINLAFNDTTAEVVVKAATLETTFQASKWGALEDVHDIDFFRLKSRAHLASLIFENNVTS